MSEEPKFVEELLVKEEPIKSMLYYMASPYTAKDAQGNSPTEKLLEDRAERATKAAIELLKQGVYVFAPIAYNAPWERHENNLPKEWWFWQKYDEAFVERMDALIVLQLEGWQHSTGVKAEIEFATKIARPVIFLSEEQIYSRNLPDTLVKTGKDISDGYPTAPTE